jgi:uncharacterized protein (TIGR00251 family)
LWRLTLDLTEREGAVSFRVRVVPRARQSAVTGVEEGVLHVRLAAPPVEGKANEALRQLLAEVLGLRKSAVEIAVGEKSRHKTVRVSGMSASEVAARLAR